MMLVLAYPAYAALRGFRLPPAHGRDDRHRQPAGLLAVACRVRRPERALSRADPGIARPRAAARRLTRRSRR